MRKILNKIKQAGAAFAALSYTPVMFAANDWFPKVPSADDMSTGSKSAMSITSNYVKQGMSLILFIVSVSMFVKFISTVSHGIEEAKKNEGGSLAVFGTFTVMAIVYLSISIATGYLGYTIITHFQI